MSRRGTLGGGRTIEPALPLGNRTLLLSLREGLARIVTGERGLEAVDHAVAVAQRKMALAALTARASAASPVGGALCW
jgi:hypothetical protein